MLYQLSSQRRKMVDCQLRPSGIFNHKLLSSFSLIPRSYFLPDQQRFLAYSDSDIHLALEKDRYLLSSTTLALMLQALNIKSEAKALVVASGVGYLAAVLSKLVSSVIALEEVTSLHNFATEVLARYENVTAIEGALVAGHADAAPYDIIFVEGRVSKLPATLLEQLKEGGELVVIEGGNYDSQIKLYKKCDNEIFSQMVINRTAPALKNFL